MRVKDVFQRDVGRSIPEVIRVNSDDALVEEIDEYVVTDHILDQIEAVFESYEESIHTLSGHTNVWVSGFFGSGKSHFVKMLGYLAENPEIGGRTVLERFTERVDAPRLKALLETSHSRAPALVVFVDMSTARDVARDGESIVLPLYRALLDRLGYSRNFLLAELEYGLESDGEIAAFEEAFHQVSKDNRTWKERRYSVLAKGEASHALHKLWPERYPTADAWAKQVDPVHITAHWFAERALSLLERRGGGCKRLVLVVDEVGQYVARSPGRMIDLEVLAVALSRPRGMIWLIVTSQGEIDPLKQRDSLALIRDRFQINIDLLPSDIEEVIARRLLDKTLAGRDELIAQLAPDGNKVLINIGLDSATRGIGPSVDDDLRFYPFAPYQLSLLIDVVSAWRASSTSSLFGVLHKPIISIAQQLVISHRIGVVDRPAGDLVTMDNAYDLLESLVPADCSGVVAGVVSRYGNNSIETQVTKVVALFSTVDHLPVTPDNISVLLHPSLAAEPLLTEVIEALGRLTADGYLEDIDGSYQLSAFAL